LQRSEAHDGVPRVTEIDDMREAMGEQNVTLATDARLAVVDGRLAGYVYTYHLPSEVRIERCYVFGTVDPTWRKQGVGRAMLAWGLDRATERLRSSTNDLPKFVRVDTYDYIEDAHRLYARLGFTPVRWFEELLRPLTELPPRHPVDGIDIVTWPDDRDEESRLVKNAAFDDHWGSTPSSPENWNSIVRGYGARPELSCVAIERSTGRIVAVCVNHRYENDDQLIGRRDGWIETLGTLAEWRGRGLASALVVESMHRFAQAGLTHASIAVDGDNPTGAARLYRALGFEPCQRSVTHEIQLS
jgi:ribosomal protein S18 acetylase RimI-like enzyme